MKIQHRSFHKTTISTQNSNLTIMTTLLRRICMISNILLDMESFSLRQDNSGLWKWNNVLRKEIEIRVNWNFNPQVYFARLFEVSAFRKKLLKIISFPVASTCLKFLVQMQKVSNYCFSLWIFLELSSFFPKVVHKLSHISQKLRC